MWPGFLIAESAAHQGLAGPGYREEEQNNVKKG